GGLIDYFVPKEYITKVLANKRRRTIFYAVGLGFLMSACSHGILAISMELYKKGASVASVIAFLLASPWANMSITILLFSFFGVKAFFIILAAIIIAIITGLIFQVLERKNMVEKSRAVSVSKTFSIKKDVAKRWKSYVFTIQSLIVMTKNVLIGMYDLAKMVLWWIILGVMLSALARVYVPADFFMNYLGATVLGLLTTLALATIIEVCSEGSSPMAFEIFKQTGAFGNSFVFLMAGVVTDYTEIGLIWSNIGRRAALWLVAIAVPLVIIFGLLFNAFL
ncbi:MAG TPA: permease, partial [Candidatus Nanoarchaeia archaeon]|nr:permease [Candidatus Nanoarchaeia archaeon]